ncbi:hypothetical protein Ciccas_013450 [Cichlidogyrus casuarinus]|uniref:Uncharacterized protein n=1 Tax=Cichlidogyrus casuarinus TaxID=1844966 RepID=A0ABD2PKL4_9PLAT
MMQCLGQLIAGDGVLHQNCIAHGAHLGVCDVIYSKKIESQEEEGQIEEHEEEDDGDGTLIIEELPEPEAESIEDVVPQLGTLLKKSRALIKQMNAPNSRTYYRVVLQGKALCLDMCTRWHSIRAMFKCIVENWSKIIETCSRFGYTIPLSDEELKAMR